MQDVYYKTLIMVITICIGKLLCKVGVFQRSDASTISKILMNVTLPCVIIKNINGTVLGLDILAVVIIGFLTNLFFFIQTYIFSKAGDKEDRMVKIFSFSSFNIGNYVIPLLSDFVSPTAMAGILAFNYPGTAVFTYGVPPVLGTALYGEQNVSPWEKIKYQLTHNVAMLTCAFMVILSLLKLSLPNFIVGICSSIGSATSTLAMLSIGILLDLSFPKEEGLYYVRIVAIRFCCAIISALCIYYFAPISEEIRRVLVLTVFAPIASSHPIVALHCGYKGSKVAAVSSLYLILSVVTMSILTLLMF